MKRSGLIFKKHQEKINFLLVGGWNTLFGYFLFLALYYLFNKTIHYMIIMTISAVISITNAYVSYKLFVFKTKGNYLKEYSRFYVVYGASFAINIVLLPFFVEIFKMSPVSAQGIVILFTVIISYLGHKNFSFSKRR